LEQPTGLDYTGRPVAHPLIKMRYYLATAGVCPQGTISGAVLVLRLRRGRGRENEEAARIGGGFFEVRVSVKVGLVAHDYFIPKARESLISSGVEFR